MVDKRLLGILATLDVFKAGIARKSDSIVAM